MKIRIIRHRVVGFALFVAAVVFLLIGLADPAVNGIEVIAAILAVACAVTMLIGEDRRSKR